jgi:nicotinamide-nucleotide amidase
MVAARVIEQLVVQGQTLATAESLTGGLIGSRLVEVPGASAAYLGGVVAYATRLKATLAGVRTETLDRLGPVAAGTAAEMAAGVRHRCGADWGLAVTGVAGPNAQNGHPVGQVFLAVSGPGDRLWSRELALTGSRGTIRTATAEQALDLLAERLEDADRG